MLVKRNKSSELSNKPHEWPEGLFLDPGQELIVQTGGDPGVARRKLVGFKSGGYLVIEPTEDDDLFIPVSPGSLVTVIYPKGGAVCAFEATYLSHQEKPFRLEFIAYPTKMKVHQLRAATRVPAHLPVLCRWGCYERSGVLVDISRSGCKACLPLGEGDDGLEQCKGGSCEIGLMLKNDGGGLVIPALVRNAKVTDGKLLLGLAFDLDSMENGKGLEEYIEGVARAIVK